MAPLQTIARTALDEMKDGEFKRSDSIYRDHISSGMFLLKIIAYKFLSSVHTFDWPFILVLSFDGIYRGWSKVSSRIWSLPSLRR